MPMHNYRELWDRAGYGTKMGSSNVVPPPPHEWVRLYHLTSAEFATNSIALGRLKVARFSDLNDPFELLSLNFGESRVRTLINDFKNRYNEDTGLLCFSKNWTSPVLWSHYAAKHTGVCLGFDVPRELVQEVTYEDERILARLADNANPSVLDQALQEQLLRTKYRHWSYEEERRIVVPLASATKEGKLYFRHFDHELKLAEVILGHLCNLSLDAVRSLTRALHHHVTTFHARLAWKSFDVVPQESTVP
jgi:Protein of unknown function (DUF2971)